MGLAITRDAYPGQTDVRCENQGGGAEEVCCLLVVHATLFARLLNTFNSSCHIVKPPPPLVTLLKSQSQTDELKLPDTHATARDHILRCNSIPVSSGGMVQAFCMCGGH